MTDVEFLETWCITFELNESTKTWLLENGCNCCSVIMQLTKDDIPIRGPECSGVLNVGERIRILNGISSLQTPKRRYYLPSHPSTLTYLPLSPIYLSHPSTSHISKSHRSKRDKCTAAASTIILEYSIDPAGIKAWKPSSVSAVNNLFRVLDVFVSRFLASDGEKKSFTQLSMIQKLEVFQSTRSTPSIKMEQIRVFHNFTFFCWKNILENYSELEIPTIKGYILEQCALLFPVEVSTWGSINVTTLLQVCLVFVYCILA